MGGTFRKMAELFPEQIEKIKKSVDCVLYFFGHKVSMGAMYAVLIGSVIALIAAYCIVVKIKNGRKGA